MDSVCGVKLVAQTYTRDAIGQLVPTETMKNVIGYRQAVSGTEVNEAGQRGIQSDCRVQVWTIEYNREPIVIIDNVRYTVYRTYENNNGKTELYLEKRVD